MKLSIEQIKRLFPSSGYVDKRGKNYYTTCPKCKQDEFGISLDTDHVFACFRKKKCGFNGNIYTLLRFLGKSAEFIKSDRPQLEKLPTLNVVQEQVVDLTLPTIIKPLGWKRVFSHPYLDERGFSLYDKFEVGICSIEPSLKHNYVVFLIRQFGDIKGYVARHVWSKKQIEQHNAMLRRQNPTGVVHAIKRYKNSTSTDFAKILLGIEECTSDTKIGILVEGIFDKEAIDRKLCLDADPGIKCLCSFKCGLSVEQLYQLTLTNIDTLIVFYDPDVLTEIKAQAAYIEQYIPTILIAYNNHTNEDPAEMSQELLIKTLEDATSVSNFSKIAVPSLKV